MMAAGVSTNTHDDFATPSSTGSLAMLTAIRRASSLLARAFDGRGLAYRG